MLLLETRLLLDYHLLYICILLCILKYSPGSDLGPVVNMVLEFLFFRLEFRLFIPSPDINVTSGDIDDVFFIILFSFEEYLA